MGARVIVTNSAGRDNESYLFANFVGRHYFQTLEIPLKSGREFSAQDLSYSAQVAIVNQQFAESEFSTTDPVGKVIRY